MKSTDITLTTNDADPVYYKATIPYRGRSYQQAVARVVVLDAPVQRIGKGGRALSKTRDGALVRVEEIGDWFAETAGRTPRDGEVSRETRAFDVGDEVHIKLSDVQRAWTAEDEERLHARYAMRAHRDNMQDRMVELGLKATILDGFSDLRVGMSGTEFERLMGIVEAARTAVECLSDGDVKSARYLLGEAFKVPEDVAT